MNGDDPIYLSFFKKDGTPKTYARLREESLSLDDPFFKSPVQTGSNGYCREYKETAEVDTCQQNVSSVRSSLLIQGSIQPNTALESYCYGYDFKEYKIKVQP